MKQILIILVLVSAFTACGRVEELEKTAEPLFPDDGDTMITEAAIDALVGSEAELQEERARENADQYTWNPAWQTVKYTYPVAQRQFIGKYYLFANENFTNGYVIIYEVTAIEEDGTGITFTIPEAFKPALYISLVDSGIQGITLERRPLGDYYEVSVESRDTLRDSPDDVKGLFRTVEAMIIAQRGSTNFTEADVKAAGERMEGRLTGLPLE